MLQLRLITVSNKPPSWITEGFQEYVKRLSSVFAFEIVEIPVEKRGNQKNRQPLIDREGQKILMAVKPQHTVVALEVEGKMWSTEDFAERLKDWQLEAKNIDFIVGGPDGLSQACLQRAQFRWSLSRLTLPHLMVRVLIAEQIYRAWTILQSHPYHK